MRLQQWQLVLWKQVGRQAVKKIFVEPLLRAVPVIAGVSDALSEATRLGLGEPVAISAETGHCPS